MDAREFAALLWLGALVAAVASRRSTRTHLAALIRTAVSRPLGAVLGMAGLYCAALLVLASRWGLWSVDQAGAALLWLGVGGGLLFNATRAGTQRYFLVGAARESLGWSATVSFFVNAAPFHWAVEVLLQPALAALVLGATISVKGAEVVHVLCRRALGLIGLGVLVRTAWYVWREWDGLDVRGLLQDWALPVLMTVAFIPFVYATALVLAHRGMWRRAMFFGTARAGRLRATVAVVLELPSSPYAVASVGQLRYLRAAAANDLEAARKAVRPFAWPPHGDGPVSE